MARKHSRKRGTCACSSAHRRNVSSRQPSHTSAAHPGCIHENRKRTRRSWEPMAVLRRGGQARRVQVCATHRPGGRACRATPAAGPRAPPGRWPAPGAACSAASRRADLLRAGRGGAHRRPWWPPSLRRSILHQCRALLVRCVGLSDRRGGASEFQRLARQLRDCWGTRGTRATGGATGRATAQQRERYKAGTSSTSNDPLRLADGRGGQVVGLAVRLVQDAHGDELAGHALRAATRTRQPVHTHALDPPAQGLQGGPTSARRTGLLPTASSLSPPLPSSPSSAALPSARSGLPAPHP